MKTNTKFPYDWKIRLLDEITLMGSGHTPSQKHPEYWNGGVKWVSLADSSKLDRRYINETEKEISDLGIKKSSAVLHPEGTVILSRDAGVGKSSILGCEMAVSQHFIAWQCTPKKELYNEYLFYWLQWKKKDFERIATGSTVKTIGLPYFKELMIAYPPLKEQEMVANLLTTWEIATEKTKRLIAIKEARFSWLVESLIGDVCGDWPHLKAEKIFNSISEKNYPNEPLLSVTQDRGVIPRGMLEGRVMSPEGSTETYKLIQKGDFVISLRSFQGGIEYSSYRGIISPAYTALRRKIAIDDDFFRHFFKTGLFISKYLRIAVIGIRDGKQISIPDFMTLKIPCPPIQEQKRVAAILNTARQEIDLHKKQLAALQKQKRGLMQKLLTGQWRVDALIDERGSNN